MVLSLICVLFWAFSDIFIKQASSEENRFSQLKIMVWNGIFFVLVAVFLVIFETDQIDFANFWTTFRIGLITVAFYWASLFCLYLSMKRFECAISSTIGQTSGAVTVIGYVMIYLLTGTAASLSELLGPIEITGTILICAGLLILSGILNKEQTIKRGRWGFLGVFIAILGALCEASGYIIETILLSGDFEYSMSSAEDYLINGMIFGVLAIVSELYMLKKEGKLYNPFRKTELSACGSSLGEAAGSLLCIYATEQAPLIAIPVTSSYCVFAVLFSRILLKEKLNAKKWICIIAVIAGIIILGFSDI